jgi:hypothetical protein
MALRTAQRALATAAALAVPGLAAAHPGHGLDPSGPGAGSWLHVVAEPEHALPLLGALCAVAFVWGLRALRSRAR